MNLSKHARWGGRLFLVALLSNVISSPGIESPTNAERTLVSLYDSRVKQINKAGIAEVRNALQEEIAEKVALTNILQNPLYDATEGRMNGVFQVDLATLQPQGRMPVQTRIEYLRRLTAAGELIIRKDQTLGKWLLGRRNAEQPTFLDALVVLKCGRALEPSTITTNEWHLLVDAKNPLCRMLAMMHVKNWTSGQEFTSVVSKALRDEYWHTRYLALSALKEAPSEGIRQTLQDFVIRDVKKGLPQTYVEMEDLLTSMAKEVLWANQGQPLP